MVLALVILFQLKFYSASLVGIENYIPASDNILASHCSLFFQLLDLSFRCLHVCFLQINKLFCKEPCSSSSKQFLIAVSNP
jgi:hypothetical protein